MVGRCALGSLASVVLFFMWVKIDLYTKLKAKGVFCIKSWYKKIYWASKNWGGGICWGNIALFVVYFKNALIFFTLIKSPWVFLTQNRDIALQKNLSTVCFLRNKWELFKDLMAGGIFGRNRDKNQPVQNSSGTRDHKIDTLHRRARNDWRVISQRSKKNSHKTRPLLEIWLLKSGFW